MIIRAKWYQKQSILKYPYAAGIKREAKFSLQILKRVLIKGDTIRALPHLFVCCCSTRVANELGGANGQAAKRAVSVVMGLSSMQAIVISSLLLVFRHQWGWVFSSDAEVVNSVSAIMPFLCCIALLDGIQGVLSGEHILPRIPNFGDYCITQEIELNAVD